ncbi:MAG: DUF7691 family protein [Polyangiales bacterium]
MSYGLVPYACDIFALRRAAGIGIPIGDAILAAVRDRQRTMIESHDRWFAAQIAEGAPTMDQALVRLILGPNRQTAHAYACGYALQILVEHEGLRLDNSMVYPASIPFLDEIDAGLAHVGIPEPFRLSRLAFSGPPVTIPPIEDFLPSVGSSPPR